VEIKSRPLSVIEQFRVAKSNPAALVGGSLLGAFVPFAVFWVSHFELSADALFGNAFNTVLVLAWARVMLVLGGLVYSAKTVWAWGRMAFSCPWKATGFVLLIEGVMTFSGTLGLSMVALGYLMVINAVATGCTMALSDKGKGLAPAAKKKASRSKVGALAVS
jgi:hypothetical protein